MSQLHSINICSVSCTEADLLLAPDPKQPDVQVITPGFAVNKWQHYVNTTPFIQRFRRFYAMLGVEGGGVLDLGLFVHTYEPWEMVVPHCWDHYADPVSPGTTVYDLGEDWLDLRPGQHLATALYYCPLGYSEGQHKPAVIGQAWGHYVEIVP